jgi:hypothetical protein
MSWHRQVQWRWSDDNNEMATSTIGQQRCDGDGALKQPWKWWKI